MADIGSRSIGELNIRKVIRGYPRSWTTIHPGDLSAATVVAYVNSGNSKIPITVVKNVYDSNAKTTTINYTIPGISSALFSVGLLSWTMELTEDLVPVPYLHGSVEVIDL